MASDTATAPPQALIDRPQSFEELTARPAFQVVLDQGEHELAAVLTDYSFASMIPCGLSKCRTPHYAGYLVQTVDGLETNVGHVCGKRNFGEAFEVLRTSYAAQRARSDLVIQAKRIKADAPKLRQTIHELNRGRFGIKWTKTVRAGLQSLLGEELFRALCAAAARGDLKVTEARERTEAEIENIVATTRQPRELVRFETVDVGTLAPMPWLDYDFGGKLRDGLMIPLQAFEAVDLEALPTPKMRAMVKQFDGADRTLEDAAAVLSSVLDLFAAANLEMLARWVPDSLAKKRRAVTEWAGSRACRELMQGLPAE